MTYLEAKMMYCIWVCLSVKTHCIKYEGGPSTQLTETGTDAKTGIRSLGHAFPPSANQFHCLDSMRNSRNVFHTIFV